MPGHVHMLVAIPPKYSVAQIMGYLKGKSSLIIFDRHANQHRSPNYYPWTLKLEAVTRTTSG